MEILEFKSMEQLQKYFGWLFMIVLDDDPRTVEEQVDERFAHGGGMGTTLPGWKHEGDGVLSYAGDPDMKPLAKTTHRTQTVYWHRHGWLLVVSEDGGFNVGRID